MLCRPIKLLRFTVSIFFEMLYISSLAMFSVAFDCRVIHESLPFSEVTFVMKLINALEFEMVPMLTLLLLSGLSREGMLQNANHPHCHCGSNYAAHLSGNLIFAVSGSN